MFGLALAAAFSGGLLVYAGYRAIDPRCLIRRAFSPDVECGRIDTDQPPTVAVPGSTAGATQGGGAFPTAGFSENTVLNAARAMSVFVKIKRHFPGVGFAGITACRHQRGSTGDPNRWSVHSVGGAVDVWPRKYGAAAVIAFAKTVPGVWGAWLDDPPGDVHVQIIPNPPANWCPPCAERQGLCRQALGAA